MGVTWVYFYFLACILLFLIHIGIAYLLFLFPTLCLSLVNVSSFFICCNAVKRADV